MARSSRPRPPRFDQTDKALLTLAAVVLEDCLDDPVTRRKHAALARGGRKASAVTNEAVTIGTMTLSDEGEAGLDMRAGSPDITVRVVHPLFNATITARYSPAGEAMTEAQVVGFEGDRAKARASANRWAEEIIVSGLNDDDDDDGGGALVSLLDDGGGTSFEGEDDPGEPPPPSPDDRRVVDGLARTLAREMKRRDPDMMAHESGMLALEDSPQSLWPILDGFIAACAAPARDEALIGAWRLLLESQLALIRYRIDRGRDWAVRMIADFQRRLIEVGQQGLVAPDDFALMLGALGEARIEVSPETRVALANAGLTRDEEQDPAVPHAMMRGLLDRMAASAPTPFEVAGGLDEAARVMPSELRCFMVHEFALSPHQVLRDTVPLMLLAEEPEVRQAAAAALRQSAAPGTLSPEALRRMIAIRNWVPEAGRPPIDDAIRVARREGVECAPWPPARELVITASVIDGSGTQSLLLTSPGPRKGILAGLLLKLGVGIADSWCDPEASRRDRNGALAAVRQTGAASDVDRAHLDEAVQHAIAVGTMTGRPPGHAVLRIAELAGGADWRDRRLDIGGESRRLFDLLPAARRSPAAIKASLERSGDWIHENFASSWFLDDAEIRAILKQSPRHDTDAAVDRLMTEAFPKRLATWAERFLLLALRSRAAKEPAWKARANDFIVLAHMSSAGSDPAAIPLLAAIARHTVEVARIARW